MFLAELSNPFADFTSGIATVLDMGTKAVTFMVGNPLCLLFIGSTLLGIGFSIFGRAKGAAKG